MAAPPASVVVSIVALLRGGPRKYAVAGLVIGGLTCCLWLVPVLCG